MVERRKMFKEDLDVFKAENVKALQRGEANIKKPPARKTKRVSKSAKELESLIRNLQALGFKIIPPSSSETLEKQEISLEKLGFTSVRQPKEEAPATPLRCLLGTQHFIAGVTYGPGEVILEPGQEDLLRTLMQQDQLSGLAYRDTTEYNPYMRCFLIEQGSGADKYNKFRKHEVSAGQFQTSYEAPDTTYFAVTAGAFDVAGYNPGFNAEEKGF